MLSGNNSTNEAINRVPACGEHFFDYTDGDLEPYDPSNHSAFPVIPLRRDTFIPPLIGYILLALLLITPVSRCSTAALTGISRSD